MSIKTPQNRRLALVLLKGRTGESDGYCKGLINRMSENEFRDLIWSIDSDSSIKASEFDSQPETPLPVQSPQPKSKKRPVGRPRGSTADSTMRLYSFNCPPGLMEHVSAIARSEMTSSAAVIRRALKRYLDDSQGEK